MLALRNSLSKVVFTDSATIKEQKYLWWFSREKGGTEKDMRKNGMQDTIEK